MTMQVLQVADELEQMVALYKERKPMHVLEIGVWHGGTLKEWLLNAADGATIVGVDLFHPMKDSYSEWLRPDVSLWAVYGDSQDEMIIDTVREKTPYDWVFIDGDHSFQAVQQDVRSFLPMIREGGLLLLHDITPPDGEDSYPPGEVLDWLVTHVGRTAETIVSSAPSDVSHGIGVVHV